MGAAPRAAYLSGKSKGKRSGGPNLGFQHHSRSRCLFTISGLVCFYALDLSHNVIGPDEWQSCMDPKHNDRLRMKSCVRDDDDVIRTRANAELECKGFDAVEL